MTNKKQVKQELRQKYKQYRREISDGEKALLDSALCRNIIELASFRYADTVLMFYPTFREPNILDVATEALRRGKRIAFPVCNVESHTMTFKYVSSLDQLTRGSYSIPEPSESCENYKDSASTLCLVPALAFDRSGYRLGYGGGYYDRFLKNFSGTSLGIVYDRFICPELPVGYYDVTTDIIISERGKIITNADKNKSDDKELSPKI